MSENPQERTFAMLCHILAFAGLVFPLGNILGPLVMWLVKKEGMPLVDDQGKESLNFQISVTIYGAACALLSFVVIGIPLAIALGVFWLAAIITGAVKASNGQRFRYPLTIRFVH